MTKNAHLKCTIMSKESVIRIIKDFSAFDAVGIAGNFDNFAVMNQTVNNCVCDDSVAKHIGPFRKRLISGKDSRSELISCGNQLKETKGGVFINRQIADFVND